MTTKTIIIVAIIFAIVWGFIIYDKINSPFLDEEISIDVELDEIEDELLDKE